MAKIGDLVLWIAGDDKQLQQKLRQVEANAKSSGQRISANMNAGMAGAIGGFVGGVTMAGVNMVLGALSQGFNAIKSSAIDMNASLETTTLQFTTLMGDADAARAHVKDLFDFAGKTPFESGPVIQALRMMRVFGGAALDTKENLTLVGDAAAATSAPIDELGTWVGRLYSSIQAGRPFGEAAMRLQELAVMSPQARAQMEQLQAAGASADQVWAVFTKDMERFNGAMALQAGTWQGLTSTISDSVSILGSTALKPLFDLAKQGAEALAQLLTSEQAQNFADGVAQALTRVIQDLGAMEQAWINTLGNLDATLVVEVGNIAGYFYELANQAIQWGAAIVEALAEGVTLAVEVIGEALQTVGEMFAYWLQPGSPPKLLPELAAWGAAAAQVWIDGWTDADWNDLGKVNDALRHLQMGMQDRLDQQRLTELDAIIADPRASAADKERARLEREQIQLLMQKRKLEEEERDKQAEMPEPVKNTLKGIKDINRELIKGLDPLDRQIRAIQLQQEELADLIQLKKDEAILNDANATAAEKEAARLDIARIQAERAKRAAEAAELGVDLKPLEQIPITLADIGKKGGEASAGVNSVQTAAKNVREETKRLIDLNFKPLQDKIAELRQGFEEGRQGVRDMLGTDGGGSKLYGTLQGIIDKLREARGEWSAWQTAQAGQPAGEIPEPMSETPQFTGFAGFLESIGRFVEEIGAKLEGLGSYAIGLGYMVIEGFKGGILSGLGTLGGFILGLGAAVVDWFKLAFGISSPAAVMIPIGMAVVEGIFTGIWTAWTNLLAQVAALVPLLQAQLGVAWTNIQAAAAIAWAAITGTITTALNDLYKLIFDPKEGWAATFVTGIDSLWKLVLDTTLGWWNDIKDGIKGILNDIIDLLNSLIRKWNSVAGKLKLPTIGEIDRLAGGTRYARGGLAIVGEQGPELVSLPRGAQVFTAAQTRGMAGSLAFAGLGPAVVIQNVTVRDEQDVYKLAYEIAGILQRRGR